jgi:glycosyltransferase involved in cell wall biosynthesis
MPLKIIHSTLVRNESHCISRMLESVLPYVDESYVMIDDRTTDNTEEIAKSYGCHTMHAKFENFAKFGNTLKQWISGKSDWYIGVAPDETINKDFGENLRSIIESVHFKPIDVIGIPRRHWADLEMTKLHPKDAGWFPDWQYRIVRNDYPRIHLRNYVHEWLVGDRGRANYKDTAINHFNMYWKPRIDYNFDEMNKLYNALKAKQRLDGGVDIWPKGDN